MNCANLTIQKLSNLTVRLIRYSEGRVDERYEGAEERVQVSRLEKPVDIDGAGTRRAVGDYMFLQW
jgi:hypothetical protein